MTQLLQRALAEVQKLSSSEQDAIGAIIIDELEDQKLWDEAFAQSQESLSRLAEKARADIRAGSGKCERCWTRGSEGRCAGRDCRRRPVGVGVPVGSGPGPCCVLRGRGRGDQRA